MARSIKKGPYVFERLLKRVRLLNESGKKEVIKDINLDIYEGEFLTLLGSSG